MPSTKLSRAAPTRVFENYTLNKVISPDVGLFPVATSNLTRPVGTIGLSGGDDESTIINIGFDFNFNNVTYKNIVISTNGFAILADPTSALVAATIINDCLIAQSNNATARASFTNDHALLCPWYDDLRNLYDDQFDLIGLGYISADTPAKVIRGLEQPHFMFNPSRAGVRYTRTVSSDGQRVLVVRWHSLTDYSTPSAVVTFDLVIYENGKIEFRYIPNSSITTSVVARESATIGIFLSNTRFRDFSYGLGRNDHLRSPYEFGGAVYTPSYTDAAVAPAVYTSPANYTYTLRPDIHWPGLRRLGCIMSFAPPVNRRKILPRNELRSRDSKISHPLKLRTGDISRMGTGLSPFDDRKSIAFVSALVDYPTRIPRSYATENPSSISRLNIFGNFNFTGSIDKNTADSFIGDVPQEYISPFSDHDRPEQMPSATGEYYEQGTNINEVGDSLVYNLKSKTQIKFELPIEYPTQLFDVTSSMYYYNKSTRGFFIPANANGRADLYDPIDAVDKSRFPEDARGFGAIGNTISSGSLPGPISQFRYQSDYAIGAMGNTIGYGDFFLNKQSDILTRYYAKSVQNNSEYVATTNEQFTLPINHPFIIEKVVFEIPFTMGDGWFRDKTTSGYPITAPTEGSPHIVSGSTFDFAGPAITVALFNQVRAGGNVQRDLILTGTIIPTGDNITNLKIYSSSYQPITASPFYIFSPEGFLAYRSTPSTVVWPNTGTNIFTGSVVVPTIAGISNGVILASLGNAASVDLSAAQIVLNRQNAKGFLTSRYTKIGTISGKQVQYVKDIDTFGRSGKSFEPSGRSIFGKEYVTTQGSPPGSFFNPFFVSSSYDEFPTDMKAVIDSAEFNAYMIGAVPLAQSVASPYLVMPGDKLTLAISKMRPWLNTTGMDPILNVPQDYFTSALRHDVSITTGSIKITVYGSLLKENREFHDPLNTTLSTDAIHDMIGNEPVLDQFDVESRDSYYGSTTDDYVTGSLVIKYSVSGKTYFYQSERGKVFSKLNARAQSMPSPALPSATPVDNYETSRNPSKAFRLQPWFERVGEQRTISLSTIGERFYDSMMPALDLSLKALGSSIFILDSGVTFGTVGKVIVGPTVGYFMFDINYGSTISSKRWSRSYPFEPIFSGIPRQLDIKKTVIANKLLAAGPVISDIQSRAITEFIPIVYGHFADGRGLYPANYSIHSPSFQTWTDVKLNVTNPNTGSMVSDDIVRAMFGFGDKNTMVYTNIVVDAANGSGGYSGDPNNKATDGSNHLPEFRDYEYDALLATESAQGPIIRGWKYGIYNGLASYSKCVFRRNRYGQFRDMLEQRPDTKFYVSEIYGDNNGRPGKFMALSAPITVKFVTVAGDITNPELTWSQNQSHEVTSSFPYEDDQFRNRPEIDVSLLNQSTLII